MEVEWGLSRKALCSLNKGPDTGLRYGLQSINAAMSVPEQVENRDWHLLLKIFGMGIMLVPVPIFRWSTRNSMTWLGSTPSEDSLKICIVQKTGSLQHDFDYGRNPIMVPRKMPASFSPVPLGGLAWLSPPVHRWEESVYLIQISFVF
jgi:hypothetical protein